ncbi:MAG: DUF427 domain-containing protein [Jatrophihabitantaceae bacterium]
MTPPRDRVAPGPGQDSVWDYPRPPACVRSDRHVVVSADARTVADSRAAYRILETSHPPTWYLPRADVTAGALTRSSTRSSFCEWKGDATYWDVDGGDGTVLTAAAWSYEHPSAGFEAIAGHLAFSPGRLVCTVDGERVRPQDGGFYAGWITDDVVGPFKGGPGTTGW